MNACSTNHQFSFVIPISPEGNVLFLWPGVAKVRGGPLFGVALVLLVVSFMLLSLLIIMLKLDIQGNYL